MYVYGRAGNIFVFEGPRRRLSYFPELTRQATEIQSNSNGSLSVPPPDSWNIMSSTGGLNSKELLTDLEAGCTRVSGDPASWLMDDSLLSTPLHGRRKGKLLGLFYQVYNSMDGQSPKDSSLNAIL